MQDIIDISQTHRWLTSATSLMYRTNCALILAAISFDNYSYWLVHSWRFLSLEVPYKLKIRVVLSAGQYNEYILSLCRDMIATHCIVIYHQRRMVNVQAPRTLNCINAPYIEWIVWSKSAHCSCICDGGGLMAFSVQCDSEISNIYVMPNKIVLGESIVMLLGILVVCISEVAS